MVMKNPCHYPDLCATGAFSSSRSDGLNLAVGLWSLNINCNQWLIIGAPASSRAGFSPSTSTRGRGRTAGCTYFSKTINPRVGAIIHPPSRQRRLNPDGGSPPHTTFVVINPLTWPWSVQSSLRDGGNI